MRGQCAWSEIPMTKSDRTSLQAPVTKRAESNKRNCIILDTTLRDGSYAVDFKFTLDDTRKIASELESAGVQQIEIGHGWGLNAESAGLGKAAHSDAEYIKAARESVKNSKFGCFFIPGVGRTDDLVAARDLGMDFVRIGNNITQYEKQEPFIRIAKKLGFYVSSNLLKSYVVSPEEFAQCAHHAAGMGADVAVLVDSSGGMMPSEVRKYIRAAVSKTQVALGFHGHNNLGLANANALVAAEEGATVIDSTLQGIGRSAGNAVTESLTLLLHESGFHTGIDPYKLMDAGEKLIRPYLRHNGGYEPIDFVLGLARFHSSFVPMVKKVADEFSIDYRHLIVEVSRVNRIDPNVELVRKIADSMADSTKITAESPVIKEKNMVTGNVKTLLENPVTL
jgi:4-hydroxy 2-oxovalerate aldolase